MAGFIQSYAILEEDGLLMSNTTNSTKKIFFLSGLPRAGNTLLASLLNQNPDIACCANSLPMEAMKELFLLQKIDVFQNYPDHKSLDNLLDMVYSTYYKDWNYKYIIDRAPVGTPGNLRLLQKHFKQDIKIIVLVRPILQVLASFIKWSNNEPTAYLHKCGATVEEKCHGLMQEGGQIWKEIRNLENLLKPENKSYALFIQYHDLVKKPQKILNKIYQFLDVPLFKHRFIDLDQLNVNGISYNDEVLGHNLHTIHTKRIELQKTNVKKLLPKEIIERYGHLKWNVVFK